MRIKDDERRFREAFREAVNEKLTLKELSQRLGIPLRRIKLLERRAMDMLEAGKPVLPPFWCRDFNEAATPPPAVIAVTASDLDSDDAPWLPDACHDEDDKLLISGGN